MQEQSQPSFVYSAIVHTHSSNGFPPWNDISAGFSLGNLSSTQNTDKRILQHVRPSSNYSCLKGHIEPFVWEAY